MAIVTQYGVRITDRVQIVSDPAAGEYVVKFDGEEIGRAHSGPHGIRIAQDWLNGRQARLEAEAQREKEEEAARIADDENEFIDVLARKLGVKFSDVERLLEIAARRAQEREA